MNVEACYTSFVITKPKKLILYCKSNCSFRVWITTYKQNKLNNTYQINRIRRGIWEVCFCGVNFSDSYLTFVVDSLSKLSFVKEDDYTYHVQVESRTSSAKLFFLRTSRTQNILISYISELSRQKVTCKCFMNVELNTLCRIMSSHIVVPFKTTKTQILQNLSNEIFRTNSKEWFTSKKPICCYWNKKTKEMSSNLSNALKKTGFYAIPEEMFPTNIWITIRPGKVYHAKPGDKLQINKAKYFYQY